MKVIGFHRKVPAVRGFSNGTQSDRMAARKLFLNKVLRSARLFRADSDAGAGTRSRTALDPKAATRRGQTPRNRRADGLQPHRAPVGPPKFLAHGARRTVAQRPSGGGTLKVFPPARLWQRLRAVRARRKNSRSIPSPRRRFSGPPERFGVPCRREVRSSTRGWRRRLGAF